LPNNDLLMVISWDAPDITPDSAKDPRRKVVFQRWTWTGSSWNRQAPVTVMDPCPAGASCPVDSGGRGFAYHRGEIAVDSQGRIWVQAFLRNPQQTVAKGNG